MFVCGHFPFLISDSFSFWSEIMIHIGLALMGAFPEFVSVYYYYYHHREQQFVHVLDFFFVPFQTCYVYAFSHRCRGSRKITEPRTFAAYACTVTLAVMNFFGAPWKTMMRCTQNAIGKFTYLWLPLPTYTRRFASNLLVLRTRVGRFFGGKWFCVCVFLSLSFRLWESNREPLIQSCTNYEQTSIWATVHCYYFDCRSPYGYCLFCSSNLI